MRSVDAQVPLLSKIADVYSRVWRSPGDADVYWT
jgi:hypothetical protein